MVSEDMLKVFNNSCPLPKIEGKDNIKEWEGISMSILFEYLCVNKTFNMTWFRYVQC
jgi:hypothetical protein